MTIIDNQRFCPKCGTSLFNRTEPLQLKETLCGECGYREERNVADWTPVLEEHGKDLSDLPFEQAFMCDLLDFQRKYNKENELHETLKDRWGWLVTGSTLYLISTTIRDVLIGKCNPKKIEWNLSDDIQWVELFDMSNDMRRDIEHCYGRAEEDALEWIIQRVITKLANKDTFVFPRKNLFTYQVTEWGFRLFMAEL